MNATRAFRSAIVLALALLAAGAPAASATTFTLLETDWPGAASPLTRYDSFDHWSIIENKNAPLPLSGNGHAATTTPPPGGGTYLDLVNFVPAAGNVLENVWTYGTHSGALFTPTTFNPATEGAIDSITYSLTQVAFNATYRSRLVLQQNGKTYVNNQQPVGPQSANMFNPPADSTWATRSFTSSLATDFFETDGITFANFASHPDFAGGPIAFGFMHGNTSGGSHGGYDNWSVRVNFTPSPVPEPGSVTLAAAGLAGALARLRRAARRARA